MTLTHYREFNALSRANFATFVIERDTGNKYRLLAHQIFLLIKQISSFPPYLVRISLPFDSYYCFTLYSSLFSLDLTLFPPLFITLSPPLFNISPPPFRVSLCHLINATLFTPLFPLNVALQTNRHLSLTPIHYIHPLPFSHHPPFHSGHSCASPLPFRV